MPFKGKLSNTARAVEQRTRAALRDSEHKALEMAKDSDRAAKYQLKKKLLKDPEYVKASATEQEKCLTKEEEKLAERRFKDKKSGKLSQYFITYFCLHIIAEWLETRLLGVHSKWDDIEHQVDIRKHDRTLAKLDSLTKKPSQSRSKARGEERLFGSGGALEKIMRDEYARGLKKLKTSSFESQAAKEEWEKFRDDLTPEELAILTREDWQ
jgi:hypothetical protein